MTIEDINEEISRVCNHLANTQSFLTVFNHGKEQALSFLKSDLKGLENLIKNVELSRIDELKIEIESLNDGFNEHTKSSSCYGDDCHICYNYSSDIQILEDYLKTLENAK